MSANRTESLDFYDYLCRKIGSEKEVKGRRLTFLAIDNFNEGQMSSGSKSEGLDLKGSDIDVMFVDFRLKVYEFETEADKSHKSVLFMDTEDTHPCFTRLYLQLCRAIFLCHLARAHHFYTSPYNQYKENNKQQYYKYTSDLSHLVIGVYSDAVVGWLMLASFFYVKKNYFTALDIIHYALSKLTDEKCDNLFSDQIQNKLIFSPKQESAIEMMKNQKLISTLKALTITQVQFESDSQIIPKRTISRYNWTIGSEKEVKGRRLIVKAVDTYNCQSQEISSGSKSEGMDLKGSDLDIMIIDPTFKVFEFETEAVQGQRVVLLMDTSDTQRCFTYLHLYTNYNRLEKSIRKVLE
ncbi:unnamed protein product [Mytilus edulis]|uniref:Uncharacterized protein n=1 Tax=Mytilus edulis TaxID=6550 RepID=A0A8S3TXW6_MYTED|nr:unnamed protein product [Mytilus edulis]